jgi:tetratricopeptide (TPR) repeat protein
VVHDYVGYREMYDYGTNINAVLDSLQDLLDDGHAELVVALAEHAIDRAEDAVGYVDDSDGWMSGIAERLQDLHLAACAALQPDPVTLARTLFDRERHSGDLEVFYGAASAYAEVLGAEGLAEYRRLAQAEWDALPPLGPKDEERSWSSRRFRITQIMQTLAELTGDVDAVVEVLARDQSSAYQFVRIAEVLREAKRYDDALAWAEKGLALHGGSDSRLVEVAAEEFHRTGRGEDAVRVTWDAYGEAPGLRTYRHLAEHAQRAGLWPAWHDKALELLRTRIEQSQRRPARGRVTRWPAPGTDSSTLVEVLLFDGDVEQAWAEASDAGCRRDLWLELARRREGEHPLEAIPIWQAEVERLIDAKKNQAYAEAVELISRVGRLMSAADQKADFTPYVAKLRATHKPKRNLMKLFDERSWLGS